MSPVHLRVSRGKNITLSLTNKVKLLNLHKQKPKPSCRPLAELSKETYNIEISESQIAKIIKYESNIQREYENVESDIEKKEDSKVWYHKRCVV